MFVPKPYCSSIISLFASRRLANLLCRTLSRVFSNMDVRLTSLHLPQLSLSPPWCTDMTFNANQPVVNRPSNSNASKSWIKGFTSGFTIAGWILSGSAAFDLSGCFRLPWNSFSVTGSFDITTIRVTCLSICPCVPWSRLYRAGGFLLHPPSFVKL